MSVLGNILWFIFGGVILFLEYLIAGVLLCCTIIGIPFGLQIFKLASLALWPFGRQAVAPQGGMASGCLNLFMNLLWIVIAGLWLALEHLLLGLLFCISIIGIPFGLQHFKLAGVAFMPFGRTIVAV